MGFFVSGTWYQDPLVQTAGFRKETPVSDVVRVLTVEVSLEMTAGQDVVCPYFHSTLIMSNYIAHKESWCTCT